MKIKSQLILPLILLVIAVFLVNKAWVWLEKINTVPELETVTLPEIIDNSKYTELVFVEDGKNDEVIVLSTTGEIIKRIKVDYEPHDITSSPDNQYVVTANSSGNSISIINVQDLSLEKTIAAGRGAHGVVFSPDGQWLFVANTDENTLSIIETANFAKQIKIKVGSAPEYVGITKDGSRIFTTNLGNNGSITLLQNAGFESQVIKEITLKIDPHGWAVSPDGQKIIITNLGSNLTYFLDAKTFEETSHIDTGATTEFASFISDTELWLTNIGAHYISIVDVKQNKIIDRINVGETPHGISFSTDKTLAFVPLYEPGQLVIINTAERKIIKKVKIGQELHNSVVVKLSHNE